MVEQQDVRIYVGSGDWGSETGALSVVNYSAGTGEIQTVHSVQAGGLLSFLAVDSTRTFIYAADEEQGKIRSFAINQAD